MDWKEIQPVHPKGNQSWNIHWKAWCWSWNSSTLATWCEELTHLKRPWCWERLKVGGEGDDRGWDGWMASPTQWTWVWVNYGSWWWTEKPGIHGVTKSQIQLSNLTGMNWHVTWFLEYIFVENLFIICLFFFIHLHELIGQYSDIPLNACNLWQSFNGSLFQVPPSTNLRQ